MATRTTRWARHVHIRQGALKGWCEKCSAAQRHTALRSVARKDGYGTLIRRLNFLRNVASRKDNPRLKTVATRDIRWAQRSLRASAR
jgi:hypothetical protein